jgi:FixJ family two-component response regulator
MTPRQLHVVIVDDDPPVRRALARLLTSAGLAVTVCGSAEEYLLQGSECKPSCLLLDVHLPRLSGIELHQLLHKLDQPVPVVFITADHELARSEEIREAGRPCLIKPVDEDALLAAIAAATSQTH